MHNHQLMVAPWTIALSLHPIVVDTFWLVSQLNGGKGTSIYDLGTVKLRIVVFLEHVRGLSGLGDERQVKVIVEPVSALHAVLCNRCIRAPSTCDFPPGNSVGTVAVRVIYRIKCDSGQ